ncbi:MAG: class I SAM-dependent methyltransferase [Thermoleophilaceae bacterium]
MSSAAARLDDVVAWHDVECASYEADCPLWRELAAERGGPVLDVGCGTGRVALDLAAQGHEVTGVDSDADLVHALSTRARAAGLPVRTHVLDARSIDLSGRRFALAIAPMQVVQLLGGEDGRAAMLDRVRAHLVPGGLLAVALADPWEGTTVADSEPPMPDIREEGGWVLSSRPVAVRPEGEAVAIERLRQAVAPGGELSESLFTIVLDLFPPRALESLAAVRGYRVLPARRIPETGDYVGSTVVMLEAEG